jgi:hypothetical protein
MADATTTSGNIYQNSGENVVAAIKEAEYDLSTRLHHDTDVIQNRIENGKDVIRSDVERNKDYLSDKLTQDYIGSLQTSQSQTDRLADRLATADQNNEIRATRGVDQLLNESRFLDIGAARRADAITLAATNNASVASRDASNGLLQSQAGFAAQQIATDRTTAQLMQQAYENANVARAESLWARDETRQAAQAQILANFALSEKVTRESEATRALINNNYTNDIRDRLERKHDELVELRGDHRHHEHELRRYERDFNNVNQNLLASQFTSQINAIGSQLQNYHQVATQGTVNFGTMAGNAGRNTSTNNIV